MSAKFDDRATVGTLYAELSGLAFQWERLKKSPLEGYFERTGIEMLVGGEEDTGGPFFMEPEVELENRTCSCCENCAIYVFLILSQYYLLTDAYYVIGLAYKFLFLNHSDRL